MIDKNRFGLNRIIAPSLGLKEFFEFAASIGISKVELRNDIGRGGPVDDIPATEAARMAADTGVEIISINALQKFNLASVRDKAMSELEALLETAREINCRAVVLCPNNDPNDARPKEQRVAETTEALSAFGPVFKEAKVSGLVEPLGFGISSLASKALAQECIQGSGFDCYWIVHDTFHHHIGPRDDSDVSGIGLVHISGVEADISVRDFLDEHRILVGPDDRMNSKEQIISLDRLGFEGDFSFEPFSPEVQNLSPDRLTDAVRRSMDFILS